MELTDFASARNLASLFLDRADELGGKPFLWAKHDGAWQSLSWAEVARQVCLLSENLLRLGLHPGDRVLLVSENRPEWCIADLAIMAAGCVTVPAYTTNTARDHQHILDDSGARAVIVSTQKLARTLLPAAQRTSGCEHVISIEPLPAVQTTNIQHHDWSALLAAETPVVAACAAGADFGRNEHTCLIYTSGTGGAPRGVMQ